MLEQFGWQDQIPDVPRVEFAIDAVQDKPTE
jgi:tRNA pseudouridine65 synthase